MSPRPYDLGKRQAQIDQTRRGVIDAARDLLAESSNYTEFTVDAIARRADVARATVYYRFGNKAGLLEALCDALAEAGRIADVLDVLKDPDPLAALHGLNQSFARFWAADRLVMRRLRSLAALDTEVHAVITGRDDRRRQMLRGIVERLTTESGHRFDDPEQLVRTLHTLTSFETFDSLAGADHAPTQVVDLVTRLGDQAIHLAAPTDTTTTTRARAARVLGNIAFDNEASQES